MSMTALRIRIKKGRDGPNSLVMIREDGSHTRQHQRTGFFAVHDLTHYAIETALGFEQAFFGLVAQGWDLEDFEKPYPRGPVPAEGLTAELMVGFLDLERATGNEWTADDLNAKAAAWFRDHAAAAVPREVSPAELAAARERMRDLVLQWYALPPGETLELAYPPSAIPSEAAR